MFCGKCGKELEKDCKVCPSCGAAVAQNENPVGKLVQSISDKKVSRKTVIAVICAVALLIVVFFGMTMGQKSVAKTVKSLNKSLEWGMSSEQVAKKLGKGAEVSQNSKDSSSFSVRKDYTYRYKGKSYECNLIAICENDRLSDLLLSADFPEDIKAYNKFVQEMTKFLGSPSYRDADNFYMDWDTGNSTIRVSYSPADEEDESFLLVMCSPD